MSAFDCKASIGSPYYIMYQIIVWKNMPVDFYIKRQNIKPDSSTTYEDIIIFHEQLVLTNLPHTRIQLNREIHCRFLLQDIPIRGR